MNKKLLKIKKTAQEISFDSAQDKQDEIFRKMPAGKKLRLTSDFSMFLLKLHKLNDKGFRKIANKNSRNS